MSNWHTIFYFFYHQLKFVPFINRAQTSVANTRIGNKWNDRRVSVLLLSHLMTSVTSPTQTDCRCCLEKYDTMTSLKPVDETRSDILRVVSVHLRYIYNLASWSSSTDAHKVQLHLAVCCLPPTNCTELIPKRRPWNRKSDGGVVSPEAAESDLLRQDDVHRVLLLLPARASRLPQQVLPLLAHQLAVLGVGQPRLTAAEEHNARGAQDHQAGEKCQQAEAEQLAVGDQHSAGVHRFLQGDLELVPLGRPEELVEGVSRQGVVLRCQC